MNIALPRIAALPRPPRFARGLEERGDAVALVTGTAATGFKHVTYAELAVRAARFAARLGAGRKLVALEAAGTAEFVAAYLVARVAGHAVALLDAGGLDGFRARFRPDAVYARVVGRWQLRLDGRTSGGLH